MTEYISGLVYCVCIYVVYVCVYVQGYNIETTKAGIHSGDAGSQFGYFVAIVRKPGWESNPNADFHDKTLLIGAPNRTVVRENIFRDGRTESPSAVKGHGDVSRCDNPTAEIITCSWMDIRDNDKWETWSNATGLCKRLRTSSSKISCEQDSRLGASLSVNRKYDMWRNSTSTLPMVTVCAPSWKNVFSKQPFLIGMCLKLREQLTVLPCITDTKRYSYCWPFWPSSGKSFTRNGRPYYALAQGEIASSFSSCGFFQRKHHQENIRQKQQILNQRKRQYRAFMNSHKAAGGQENSQLAAASDKCSPIATTSDEYSPIASASGEYSPMAATASDENSPFQPPATNMSQ